MAGLFLSRDYFLGVTTINTGLSVSLRVPASFSRTFFFTGFVTTEFLKESLVS
jgi:hypothetical protein